MKKLLYIPAFLLAATLLPTSCDKVDDTAAENASALRNYDQPRKVTIFADGKTLTIQSKKLQIHTAVVNNRTLVDHIVTDDGSEIFPPDDAIIVVAPMKTPVNVPNRAPARPNARPAR